MVVAMTQQMGKTMNEPMKAGPRAVVIAVEHGVDGTAPAWQVEVATRSQLASRESRRGSRVTHPNAAVSCSR
jgi:hypothetical protein